MATARLDDRSVVAVSGAEARAFLGRLTTCDVDEVTPTTARFGALLTPQGKIIADFVITERSGDTFYLETAAVCVGDLVKRLNLYRLRAKIAIADASADLAVVAGWDEGAVPEGAVADPRLAALGWRAVLPAAAAPDPDPEAEAAYQAHRLVLGVPEGGRDYAFGDAFPHEALMDQFGGVDFDKGCYVGQEVVSRMQHRGTARTRIVPLVFEGAEAVAGADVVAGGRVLGGTGSASGRRALAAIRLDRAQEALAAGEAITAAGIPVRIGRQDWVRFAVPGHAVAPAVPAA